MQKRSQTASKVRDTSRYVTTYEGKPIDKGNRVIYQQLSSIVRQQHRGTGNAHDNEQ